MTDTASLFPGFAAHWLDGEQGRIFARIGGKGPPLFLLHGFPQTHAMWHAVAPALAQTHTVICPDLRGYGWSSAPRSTGGEIYSKRAMGRDLLAMASQLGFVTFACAGHDRGGRVAYRLALDEPGRVTRLALLDILPTVQVWQNIRAGTAPAAHWEFLARPAPEPETVIQADPIAYFEGLLAKWTRTGDLKPFQRTALNSYRASFSDPARIRAMCEDYRAGATLDLAADEADLAAGRRIDAKTLILSGDFYLTGGSGDALAIWQQSFAPGAKGRKLPCGHFVAEEEPAGTLAALQAFFERP